MYFQKKLRKYHQSSLIKVINLKKAKKYFAIEEKKLENVDKILK